MLCLKMYQYLPVLFSDQPKISVVKVFLEWKMIQIRRMASSSTIQTALKSVNENIQRALEKRPKV